MKGDEASDVVAVVRGFNSLEEARDDFETQDRFEELRRLYVAFTRACRKLTIVIVGQVAPLWIQQCVARLHATNHIIVHPPSVTTRSTTYQKTEERPADDIGVDIPKKEKLSVDKFLDGSCFQFEIDFPECVTTINMETDCLPDLNTRVLYLGAMELSQRSIASTARTALLGHGPAHAIQLHRYVFRIPLSHKNKIVILRSAQHHKGYVASLAKLVVSYLRDPQNKGGACGNSWLLMP